MQKRTRFFFLLTLVAFLSNALLPFFAVYNLPADKASAREMSSLFGDRVLICTSDGFKWMTWEELESGNHPAPHPDYQCPICYVAVHGLKATAAQVDLATADIPPPHEAVLAYVHLPAASHLQSQLRNRAPPFPFIG